MESGSAMGTGGRVAYDGYLEPETWQHAQVDEALRQANW